MAFETRGLGYVPDRVRAAHETQDKQASSLVLPEATSAASVRKWVMSVLDQLQIGSCVTNAGAQAVRVVHRRKGIPLPMLLSRLYAYYAGRVLEGTVSEDAGMQIRDFFRLLNKFGFVPESLYPYDLSKWQEEPNDEIKRAGLDQRAPAVYHRITELGDAQLTMMRRALSAGHPVVFGVDVDEAFCMNAFDPKANLERPASGSGHCMMVEGYDSKGWIILNSWGATDFGDMGRCRFSDEYMASATDNWIISDAPYFSEAA